MSCNYADSLSHYENKGKLGLPEKFDGEETIDKNVQLLCKWLKESKHTVVHTGAGVSTSAGIPDFRGPNGVWTLEEKGKKPPINISWDDAKPTFTHMALCALLEAGYISYIITQNVDGLHLRSGIPRKNISELHGNLFVDKCNICQKQFIRHKATETVAQKSQGISCPGRRCGNGRKCRGKLHDTILDWEDNLPEFDLDLSHMNACIADLSLCLGTTLQILPSGNLPVHTKKRGGKLVICNLQPTKQDKHADILIHTYVDDILRKVLKVMGIEPVEYDTKKDFVLMTRDLLSNLNYDLGKPEQFPSTFKPYEYTILEEWVKDKDLLQKVKNRKVVKVKRTSLGDDMSKPKKFKIDSRKINLDIKEDTSVVDSMDIKEDTSVLDLKDIKEDKSVVDSRT